VLHPAFVDRLLANSSPRFIAGITTFGTFLASFVLSVMTATGKREMGLMPDARSVRMMEQRLRWLLSDQLIMVVSALAAAVCGLIWMAVETLCVAPPLLLTAAVVAFGGLAGFNALRLPFQIWELQFSALMEDRKRAHERLNKQNDEHFKD
jgi:hypothetical protein